MEQLLLARASAPAPVEGRDGADSRTDQAGPSAAREKITPRTLAKPPPIWAESRQELCETLSYFRAFQSGCYHIGASNHSTSLAKLAKTDRSRLSRDGTPFSYLLGGFGSPRDAWAHAGRVVISHGGGKAGAQAVEDEPQEPADAADAPPATPDVKGKGKASVQTEIGLQADQEEHHPQITALIQSHRLGTPIVLLVSEDYRLLDFRLPCAFAVLGWYAITDFWTEREGQSAASPGFVRFKFRFEWLESQGRPWWIEGGDGVTSEERWDPRRDSGLAFGAKAGEEKAATPEPATATHEDAKPAKSLSKKRKTFSKRRFIKRPQTLTSQLCGPVAKSGTSSPCSTCGVASPGIFAVGQLCVNRACPEFWRIDGASPDPRGLTFVDDFLAPRPQSDVMLPFDLRPPQPDPKATEALLTSAELLGLHCLACNRISSRQDSIGWTCAWCRRLILASSAPLAPPPITPTTSTLEEAWINPRSGLTVSITTRDGLRWATYAFPDFFGAPRVHVVQKERLDDVEADRVFEALQATCERSPEGGYDFKDVVRFKRHPLSNHQMKGTLLSQQFTSNFGVQYKHTVNLGTTPLDEAPPGVTAALAMIQERTRIVTELGKDFNEIYPVKYVEGQRMNFHDDGEPGLGPVVSSLSLGVAAEMSFRLKAKFLSPPGSSRASQQLHATLSSHVQELEALRKDRVVLKVPLPHGSICIQDGASLQVYFEHMVEPLNESGGMGAGGLRIALTARRIDAQPIVKREPRPREPKAKAPKKRGLEQRSTMKPPPAGWDGSRFLGAEQPTMATSAHDERPPEILRADNNKKKKKKKRREEGSSGDAEAPRYKGARQTCPRCQMSLCGPWELKRHLARQHPDHAAHTAE